MVKRILGCPREPVGERVLADDEFWVVGDREDVSTDSRHFGPVRREQVKAKVLLDLLAEGAPRPDPLNASRDGFAAPGDVLSGATAAHVGPGTADEEVITALTHEPVAAGVPGQLVVAGTADQVVVAHPSTGPIDVEGALEHVVAAASEEDVSLEPTREVVVTRGPDDRDRSPETEHELIGAAIAIGSRSATLIGRAGIRCLGPGQGCRSSARASGSARRSAGGSRPAGRHR